MAFTPAERDYIRRELDMFFRHHVATATTTMLL
jgi:hypothetical protein